MFAVFFDDEWGLFELLGHGKLVFLVGEEVFYLDEDAEVAHNHKEGADDVFAAFLKGFEGLECCSTVFRSERVSKFEDRSAE